MREITLEKACDCCPEQYWAHSGTKTIGYIRLRWGQLTCDYLPSGKPQLAGDSIRVLEHKWEDDDYKGGFDNEAERTEWLDKCKEALITEFFKHNKN